MNATVEQITVATKANVEKLTIVAKNNAEALTQSGTAAVSGIETLAKAYQALASKNFEKLTASFQALSSVKTPVEFFQIQQKLVTEGFETALADGQAIAELTKSVFTAAFEPVKKQVEAVQTLVKTAA